MPSRNRKKTPRFNDVRITLDQYRQAAKRLYQDEGAIEIDDGAKVSKAPKNPDHGAYVQAWVWVPDADASLFDGIRGGRKR